MFRCFIVFPSERRSEVSSSRSSILASKFSSRCFVQITNSTAHKSDEKKKNFNKSEIVKTKETSLRLSLPGELARLDWASWPHFDDSSIFLFTKTETTTNRSNRFAKRFIFDFLYFYMFTETLEATRLVRRTARASLTSQQQRCAWASRIRWTAARSAARPKQSTRALTESLTDDSFVRMRSKWRSLDYRRDYR